MYRCGISGCIESFVDQLALNTHKSTIHRKYVCVVCNKDYTTQGTLNEHVRVEHEKKMRKCECGFECARSNAMSRHKKGDCPLKAGPGKKYKKIFIGNYLTPRFFSDQCGARCFYKYAFI